MATVATDEILSRRERNKSRTRRNILAAARACFGGAGIAATTMDEIAERADVSRGTLFNYFPSKAEIVAALVREQSDAFCTIIEDVAASSLPVAGRLESIFVESARSLAANPVLARRLLDPSEQGWSVGNANGGSTRRLIEALAAILTTASDAEQVRRDVPARDLAEILLGIYSGIAMLWRLDETYPLEAKLAQAARLAHGLVMAG